MAAKEKKSQFDEKGRKTFPAHSDGNETMLEAARRRVERERRAQKIVERLLDESISESFFEDCGKFITARQFDDVATERAIERLCGYPLCHNKLKAIPSQKYHISLTSKKVYDITERKNFCSQFCYQAHKYYQAQLTEEPVWTRDPKSMPPLKLLKRDSDRLTVDGRSFTSQDEIILKHQQVKKSDVDTIPEGKKQDSADVEDDRISDDLSALCFAEDSREDEMRDLKETPPSGSPRNKDKPPHSGDERVAGPTDGPRQGEGDMLGQSKPQDSGDDTNTRSDQMKAAAEPGERKEMPCPKTRDGLQRDINEGSNNNRLVQSGLKDESKASGDISEQDTNRTSDITASKNESSLANEQTSKIGSSDVPLGKKRRKKKAKSKPAMRDNPVLDILRHVQQCIREWWTEETLRHLYGRGATPPGVQEGGSGPKTPRDGSRDNPPPGGQVPAGSTDCKQAPRDFESDVSLRLSAEEHSEGALGPASKPLPDFQALHEEQEQYASKVKEFFSGRAVPAKTKPDVADEVKEQPSVPNDRTMGLPPVDSRAQVTIRRKILLERLGKVLPDLVASLHLSMREVNPAMTGLVRTFQPASHNVVFKPLGWTFLAILLIHLLAEREANIRDALETASTKAFLTSMLSPMGLEATTIRDMVHQLDEGRRA